MAKKGKPGATGRETTTGTDTLYSLPLSEFTAARNALAGRLKKAGRGTEAAAVKALPKPSIAAWVVNQLHWRHGRELTALLAAGDRFRAAQGAQLSGGSSDLRGALEGRRAALAGLLKQATALLETSEHAVTPDLLRRVSTTLEALSAYGSDAGTPLLGRLQDDLSPPGFETLASLVPRGVNDFPEWTEGPSRVLRFKGAQKRDAGDERSKEEVQAALELAAAGAVRDAEQAVALARREAEDAERELKGAAAHAKAAETIRADLSERLEKATTVADAARTKAHQVAGDAEQAAQRVEDAERELERARTELARLTSAPT